MANNNIISKSKFIHFISIVWIIVIIMVMSDYSRIDFSIAAQCISFALARDRLHTHWRAQKIRLIG